MQIGADAGADLVGIFAEAFRFDDVEGGERRRAGQRVAAKGRAVAARLEQRGGFATGYRGTDRHTAAETLGERHHIRHHTVMLEGEHLAGTRHAGLYFIEHQQPAMGVADFTQPLQVSVAANADAAFALHQLRQYGNDVAVGIGDTAHGLKIVERHSDESGHQRLEAGLNLAAAGGGQRCHGAAVERFFEHHHCGILDALLVAVVARQLDRRFVGFRAGIAEKHLVHAGGRNNTVGEFFLGRDLVDVGGVDQLADLFAQRCDQLRVAVADRVDGHSSECVQVAFALRVPQPDTLTALKGDGQAAVGVHDV